MLIIDIVERLDVVAFLQSYGQRKNRASPKDGFELDNSYYKEFCHLCKIFQLVLDASGENYIFVEIYVIQRFLWSSMDISYA